MLSALALVVMILLVVLIVVAASLLAGLPGRVAQKRQHPQTDAIRVCGWLGHAPAHEISGEPRPNPVVDLGGQEIG